MWEAATRDQLLQVVAGVLRFTAGGRGPRGDVSVRGESFVSGHAVLVAALAGVIAPYLPGRWKAVPWVLVALVMLGRVYVGAHNPLDVVCGAALGVAIASGINLLLAVPTDAQPHEG